MIGRASYPKYIVPEAGIKYGWKNVRRVLTITQEQLGQTSMDASPPCRRVDMESLDPCQNQNEEVGRNRDPSYNIAVCKTSAAGWRTTLNGVHLRHLSVFRGMVATTMTYMT